MLLTRAPKNVGTLFSRSCGWSSPNAPLKYESIQPRIKDSTSLFLSRPSSSSIRWKTRQGKDSFAKEAKLQGLKSRAAFKILEIDAKYKLFKKGQTIVDLGFAPGSWSQVAVERTKPNGRVIGIDTIPAQPPKGVSTIQGNFLSLHVRDEVKRFLSDPDRGRPKHHNMLLDSGGESKRQPNAIFESSHGYIDAGRYTEALEGSEPWTEENLGARMVDVVLSDMSAPFDQISGFWKRSLSDPYLRMMNTSGINFRDHAGSMDLCAAALDFARDTLKLGGHFVCKFYQGAEDKELEKQLRNMFNSVHREKPGSSRSASSLSP